MVAAFPVSLAPETVPATQRSLLRGGINIEARRRRGFSYLPVSIKTSNEAPPIVMFVVYCRSAESSSGEDPARLPRRCNPRRSRGIRRPSKLSRRAHEKSPRRTKARSEAGNFKNIVRRKEQERIAWELYLRRQCLRCSAPPVCSAPPKHGDM